MTHQWQVINEEKILDVQPWFSVVKQKVLLPDNRVVEDFYQIYEPDYAEIVAVDAEQKILGLWHYKHGVGKYHLGLPAGYIESGETPLMTAQRELLEECQLDAKKWHDLGAFVLEGNRKISTAHLFLALDCEPSTKRHAPSDDLEKPELDWLTLDEWLNYIQQGQVATIGTVSAILLAQQKLK